MRQHGLPGFADFFTTLTHQSPYPYQERLAALASWPDLLPVPTGLGKTAAVIAAWLYRRLGQDPQTPRRLIFCLPMRVLVEQTARNAAAWVEQSTPYFQAQGLMVPGLHLLMGGDVDSVWAERPEQPAILIGTQDMLLSRALLRGYGMSRYLWPVHFALLHNDALWVFDEVQLMGAGLTTSAQLEALRRLLDTARPSHSLWISATLNPAWLGTIDLRPWLTQLQALTLDSADQAHPDVTRRLHAHKGLRQARTTLNPAKRPAAQPPATAPLKRAALQAGYSEPLAAEVLSAHCPGTITLIILNQVTRAQDVFKALREQASELDLLLLHARFRAAERRALDGALQTAPGAAGRIIVATQAIEAGVDLSAATLFTELAPWPALVQRFGRCNRYGEFPETAIYWIDLDLEADPATALPYDIPALESARARLQGLSHAAPAQLPPTDEPLPPAAVLRRRDLLDLFNTDPDLSGFDVDVGVYIRDTADSQAQVFWRAFTGNPNAPLHPAPAREELCPVSLSQLRAYLDKKVDKARRTGWIWDSLEGEWRELERDRVRPGLQILLPADRGGYDPVLGFRPEHAQAVPVLAPADPRTGAAGDYYASDWRSQRRRFVELSRHLCAVEDAAGALCDQLGEQARRRVITRAARWHDVGKAHLAFQTMLLRNAADAATRQSRLWAKGAATSGGHPVYGVWGGDPPRLQLRPHFRHELASMLAWLAQGSDDPDGDLIAYLIAAHHGKVRLGLRALPEEAEPPEPERRFARGVWEGDTLPPVVIGDRESLPATRLDLGVMVLGQGPRGASWLSRTRRLLAEHGPFRLAWLETLVRIADWRASAQEQEAASDDP